MTSTGFGLALVVSAFGFGFRHGIDWDHLAAITDITSSQRTARDGMRYATLYAAGHGVVVFVIGVAAIAVGRSLPAGVDAAMGRVVGATLVILGVYVLYALVRYRRDFRLRSRWMLLFDGARRAYRSVGRRTRTEHKHAHVSTGAFPHHEPEARAALPIEGASTGVATATHTHRHAHTDPFTDYGRGTSIGVGMIHGVGAETPTQVLIFLAAAGAGGVWTGVAVLGVFLVGLFAANTLVAAASASGFLSANRSFPVYAAVSIVVAVGSLIVGGLFLLGGEDVLPAFFSG